MWSKLFLCRFQHLGQNQQTPVLQGFAAFRLTLSRIQPRYTQSRRATSCATPGYLVVLSGWAYSPKASALPTALHPDIQFFLHDTMRRRKKQVFRVCGRRCGQARFCESFSTREFPPQATVPKASGSSLSGKWIGYLSSQKGRHTTNCANLEQTVLV